MRTVTIGLPIAAIWSTESVLPPRMLTSDRRPAACRYLGRYLWVGTGRGRGRGRGCWKVGGAAGAEEIARGAVEVVEVVDVVDVRAGRRTGVRSGGNTLRLHCCCCDWWARRDRVQHAHAAAYAAHVAADVLVASPSVIHPATCRMVTLPHAISYWTTCDQSITTSHQ